MDYNKLTLLLIFWKIFGLKNFLYFLFIKYRILWHLPMLLPIFGLVKNKEEIINIRDNIFQGSLRDLFIENKIRKAKKPVIVDCGINVGITVRWWFYLNPKSLVYGIDMMQEAHSFTMESLPKSFKGNYIPIAAVLASQSDQRVDVKFDDPLFGGNSAEMPPEEYAQCRSVRTTTLDDSLSKDPIKEISLLKIDIEGSAVSMLRGATQTLKKVRNVFLEWHNEQAKKGSVDLLRGAGFFIRKKHKRHIWFKKAPQIFGGNENEDLVEICHNMH